MSDRLIRGVMLFGSAAECAARVDAYRAAGVDVPVVYPNAPAGRWPEAFRRAITAFAPSTRSAGGAA